VADTNLARLQTDADMVLLLQELAEGLSSFERDLLLAHIRDGKSLSQIAAERGASQRTMRRAWLRLKQHLRRALGPEPRATIGRTD
jgi:DNA-directed RNA polymerase specialized sigma24 family protein